MSASQVDLTVDEDQIGDSERTHGAEQVAYLVFEEALVYPEPVVAGFSAAPLSGTVPLTVTFTNTTTGTIADYLWTFGDGVTSVVTHLTHVYTATGVYTVSLAATGPGGSDTLTRTNYITVSSASGGLVTTTITYDYDDLYRLITATYSSGEVYTYTYDKGDSRRTATA